MPQRAKSSLDAYRAHNDIVTEFWLPFHCPWYPLPPAPQPFWHHLRLSDDQVIVKSILARKCKWIRTKFNLRKLKWLIKPKLNPFAIEFCLLSDNIMDYYVVSQGKTSIPGVDDAEECTLTDVRYSQKLSSTVYRAKSFQYFPKTFILFILIECNVKQTLKIDYLGF